VDRQVRRWWSRFSCREYRTFEVSVDKDGSVLAGRIIDGCEVSNSACDIASGNPNVAM
jgi:hypothetical protein